MAKYSVANKDTTRKILNNCPVVLMVEQEIVNSESLKHFLQFKFVNNGSKTITSFVVAVRGKSGEISELLFDGLNVKPGESFGGDKAIFIEEGSSPYSVIPKSIVFADGTDWINSVSLPFVCEPAVQSSEFVELLDGDIKEEKRKKDKRKPVKEDDEEDDEDEDEEDDEDEEPKKKHVGLIIIIILLVLAIAGFLVWNFFIKHDCSRDGHEYGAWIVKTEANCVHTGEKYKECEHCGYRVTETIAKTEHKYSGNICTVCGYEKVVEPSMTVLFKATTLVELHVRSGPGLSYSVTRKIPYMTEVSVYETKQADGYTWNRINKTEWIANDGTWLQK